MADPIQLSISNIAWDKADDEAVYTEMKAHGFTGLELAPTRIFPEEPYEQLTSAMLFGGYLKNRWGFCVPSIQSIWYGQQGSIFNAGEAERLLDYTAGAYQFAHALNCPSLVFGCPKNRTLAEGDDPAAELTVMSLAFRAAALLTRHMPAPGPLAVEADRRSLSLRRMLGYVQRHYAEKLSVRDIARAGGVSVSSCCEVFRKHTGQTPGGYLIRYRLQKGMEQLSNPNLTVAEVARSVGFASSSYFTECFKRYLHVTPLAYRRNAGEKRAVGL